MATIATHKAVLRFIAHFSNTKEPFLNQACYWFAHMLKSRFRCGYILYDQINGHFLWSNADGRLYDVTGEVIHDGRPDVLVCFDAYKSVDSLHYERIKRDCIDI